MLADVGGGCKVAAMDHLLTPTQVASKLGVAKQTLANWASQGIGPPYLKIGKLRRYPPKGVDAWIKEQPTS